MAITVDGKDFLVKALDDATTLVLTITYTDDSHGSPTLADEAVAYGTPVQSGGNAYVDITANVTFTVGTGGEVTAVSLYDGASSSGTLLATQALTTDNTFPNGGDLIVTSYKITVS